jgi:cytochrome P450
VRTSSFFEKVSRVLLTLRLQSDYNPDVFPNPEDFRPSRWTKLSTTSEKQKLNETGEAPEPTTSSLASSIDGFMGFSFGPRTCLGHKFAKVEAVCFLTNVLREWRVEVVLAEGETMAEWKERVLKPRFEVTLNFGEVPIRLVRRSKM